MFSAWQASQCAEKGMSQFAAFKRALIGSTVFMLTVLLLLALKDTIGGEPPGLHQLSGFLLYGSIFILVSGANAVYAVWEKK